MGAASTRRRVAVVCALAFAAATAGPVAAQPDGEIEMEAEQPAEPPADGGAAPVDDETAKADARKLLDGGDAFLKKGDALLKRKKAADAKAQYERALAAYQKAYELVPNPQILYPIAIAEEKLLMWPEAARDFKRFLTRAPDASPKLRAEAEKRLEAVKLNLGVLTLVVTPADANVEVTLDGAVIGRTPDLEPLYLPAGEYTLAFSADGYQPLEQKVAVETGSESERTFELQPIPIIVETPKPPPRVEPEIVLPPAPSRVPVFLTTGLAIGLAAGATATGLLAVGKHNTFMDESVSLQRREDAQSSGKRLALLTDGLIIGSVVAAGIATYYYVKVYRPKVRARDESARKQRAQFDEFASAPKVLVTPWVERSAGGLVLTGAL